MFSYGIIITEQHGWCSEMKKVLSHNGLSNLYENISVDGFSARSLLTLAETKLKTDSVNRWNTDILNQPKHRTYIQIKDECKCEYYVAYRTN